MLKGKNSGIKISFLNITKGSSPLDICNVLFCLQPVPGKKRLEMVIGMEIGIVNVY